MKFGREIRWAARALWLLDRVQSGKLTEQQTKRLPLAEVRDKLGWLEGYRKHHRKLGANLADQRPCNWEVRNVATGSLPSAVEQIANPKPMKHV